MSVASTIKTPLDKKNQKEIEDYEKNQNEKLPAFTKFEDIDKST